MCFSDVNLCFLPSFLFCPSSTDHRNTIIVVEQNEQNMLTEDARPQPEIEVKGDLDSKFG
jgi:hypothetical protein